MGAAAASKTIWYSVAHLKFNNIANYMKNRLISPNQSIGIDADEAISRTAISNGPDAFIYVGKCTFNYELYNPTNYIITCYIYDLICKRDTPYGITYSDVNNDTSSAPENCMQKGSESMRDTVNNPSWTVADPTDEQGTYFNSLGMKPTDYHLFNTLWKVKGLKKIILPPGSSHHHVVIFNPKTKITNASLFYPHENWTANDNIVNHRLCVFGPFIILISFEDYVTMSLLRLSMCGTPFHHNIPSLCFHYRKNPSIVTVLHRHP